MENKQLYKGITNGLIPDYLYKRLPSCLCPFLDRYHGREKDVVLVSALGAISSCLPNIAGYYDQRLFYANLYVMVSAPAASGKGVLNKARLLVDPIHSKLLEISRQKIAEWEAEQKKDKKDRKNKEDEPKPLLQIKILAGDTSSAQFYAFLKSSPNGLFMMETEADTIGNMLSNDWSSYSPILRNSFQHEPLSVVRKDNDTFIEIQNPKLSVLLSGTPEQFKNIIRSKENGLFSRFLVYAFDDIQTFKNVFEEIEGDPDEPFKTFGQQLYKAYENLQDPRKPILFEFTKPQKEKFLGHYRNIHKNISEEHPNGFLSNLNRFALIHFKIAMILSSLRNLEDLHEKKKIICTNSDFLVSLQLTSIFIKHALVVYYTFEESVLSEADEKLLFDLKPTFTRQEALEEGKKYGIPTRTLDDRIKKWKKLKVITVVGHGVYRRNMGNK